MSEIQNIVDSRQGAEQVSNLLANTQATNIVSKFEFLQEIADFLSLSNETIWISQVFVVILSTFIIATIINRVLLRLAQKTHKSKNIWDDSIVVAIRPAVKWAIIIIGITFAIDIIYLASENKIHILLATKPIRVVTVISAFAWSINRFITESQKKIIQHYQNQKKKYDLTTIDAVSKILRISVIITAILIILQSLGFSVSGILAFGGIGGVAIGFAAKDLLANFFGAMMIYFDRPFKVGDWIRSPDKNIEGTVEEIGWRLTRIRTFDKRPLYVPNSVFASIAVENPSRMLFRRIYETIGIRYDDVEKMPKITEQVKRMLLEHDEIAKDQTLIVNFNQFSASSLDFFVYVFTKTTDWIKFHEVKQDVLLKISQIILDNGAQIAYPTSTIHLAENQILTQKVS